MPNEDGTETPQSPTPETPVSTPPQEAAPFIPQAAAEHINLFQKLVAKIQSTFGGKKDASANVQPSAPTETPQPLSPPTPGTPTT